jgi:hypothetical protein
MGDAKRQPPTPTKRQYPAREAILDPAVEAGFVDSDGRCAEGVIAPGSEVPAVYTPPEPPEPTLEERVEWFWDAREELQHIGMWADRYTACRWGVLGAVISRVLAATEPNIVLPGDNFGSDGSLNTCLALVGESGAGKDTSMSIAERAVKFVDVTRAEIQIDEEKPGSGEGLTDMFVKIVQPGRRRRPRQEDGLPPEPEGIRQVQYRSRVWAVMSEIDTLTAQASRRGSTLLAELKTAFSGGRLGHFYRDEAKRTSVPSHAYRLSVVIGVQPGKGRAILDDADGGTPQRFLWMPVQDRSVPHPDEVHVDEIYPVEVVIPRVAGRRAIKVCRSAVRELKEARYATVSKAAGREPLAGHRLFVTLKVAAALSLLSEKDLSRKLEISEMDWELAKLVVEVSDRTLGEVVECLAEAGRQEIDRKAFAAARQAEVVESRRDESQRGRTQRRVLTVLGRQESGSLAFGRLRADCGPTHRDVLPEVLDAMVKAGELSREEGRQGVRYSLRR